MNHFVNKPIGENFPWLDGLRGAAAIWVLLSHVQILTGVQNIPIISMGGVAVDLFMMLSGFLMTHHYLLREDVKPLNNSKSWVEFWLRRFFRIAPLYYFILTIAFLLGPWIGDNRNAIAAVWPWTATLSVRYFDNSFENAITHITFIFGALPEYSFRTPLPDWSIGLEMQFYLIFPFIMLLMKKFGFILGGVALMAICVMLGWQFNEYFDQFSAPSFLPMKLYVFIIGIWLAVSRILGFMRFAMWASVAITSAMVFYLKTSESIGILGLTIGIFYIMSDGTLVAPVFFLKIVEYIKVVFSGKIFRFLGDTSYGLYLIHLLILIPIAGMLTKLSIYVSAPGIVRFIICLVAVAPLSLLFAWFGHKVIELRGIRWGKAVSYKLA